MKRIKSLKFIIAAVAVGLILTAGVGSTFAYFSTYAEAKGGVSIALEREEEIHEEVTDFQKTITIFNKEKSQPVYVRARAFTGSKYTLSYSGDGWTDGGDGWWYYEEPLAGGETTGALVAGIDNVPTEDLKDGDIVNIAVVYESTLVLYRYNEGLGDYEPYADWDKLQEGGNE